MSGRLRSLASRTRTTEVLDECSEVRPRELSAHQGEGFIQAVVACEQVVVPVTQDSESEVIAVGDVNFAIVQK